MTTALERAIPPYLQEPAPYDGRTYGRLMLGKKNGSKGSSVAYVIEADPSVLQAAKRMFPGSTVTGRRDIVTFPATRRAAGDLAWFMLRYPLEMLPEAKARFALDREEAIDHAVRRDEVAQLGPVTPPSMFAGELLPFQAEDLAQVLANKRCVAAWDTGLGKTVLACAMLATASAFPALVVVPQPSLVPQWCAMLEKFLGLAAKDVHVIKGLKPYDLPSVPIHVIHYGLLRGWKSELPEEGYRAVVFDEIAELRHTGTDKYSAASLVAGGAEYVLGLSATPIYNYGAEIWSVLNIIDYQCLGDFESFTREWCSGYGNKIITEPDILSTYLRREGLLLRRRTAEVQSQLPRVRQVVQLVGKDEGKYATLVREAVAMAHRVDEIKDWMERGRTMRDIDRIARQATGIAKAHEVAHFVRGLVTAGEKVLVFAHHHAVHELIAEGLKEMMHEPVRITGMETLAEKELAKAKFMRGETNVILLALRSTAGLDGLQERGTCVVFAELDWSPAVHTQCEGRLHRMGVDESLESILAYYLVTDTGSDETMPDALGLKIAQFVGVMGDAPQTEEDRVLAAQTAERHMEKVITALKTFDAKSKGATA